MISNTLKQKQNILTTQTKQCEHKTPNSSTFPSLHILLEGETAPSLDDK